jgi:hypothetical protein
MVYTRLLCSIVGRRWRDKACFMKEGKRRDALTDAGIADPPLTADGSASLAAC